MADRLKSCQFAGSRYVVSGGRAHACWLTIYYLFRYPGFNAASLSLRQDERLPARCKKPLPPPHGWDGQMLPNIEVVCNERLWQLKPISNRGVYLLPRVRGMGGETD